jgi:hypothetical protein
MEDKGGLGVWEEQWRGEDGEDGKVTVLFSSWPWSPRRGGTGKFQNFELFRFHVK